MVDDVFPRPPFSGSGRRLKKLPEHTSSYVAGVVGRSVRTVYYMTTLRRYGVPELLEDDIVNNIGMRTLADLARHFDDDAQREFVSIVREKGVREANRLINEEFRDRGLR